MTSSEQLERQSEQSRAEVELTIDELRARLTPGQIIDEILSYARDGGRQFTSNLGRQISNNPLPVVLMGAGMAWFLFGREANASMGNGSYRAPRFNGQDRRSGEWLGELASGAGERMHEATGSVRHAAEGAVHGVRHAAESAGEAVSDTAHRLKEGASSAYHTASSKVSDMAANVGTKATAVEQKTLAAARDLIEQVKAQPLMLVGLGLALGAAVGAAFPASELENRVMGDTADEVKREAKQVASEKIEQAKDAAQHYVEDAVNASDDTANPPGNGSDNANRQGGISGHYG